MPTRCWMYVVKSGRVALDIAAVKNTSPSNSKLLLVADDLSPSMLKMDRISFIKIAIEKL